MDTYTQAITPKRRYRALEEKRRIVEETLVEGASVALIARAHGVNANLVFNWRRQYQAGRLGSGRAELLPVRVTVDCRRGDRSAAGLHGAECTGADQVGAESDVRPGIIMTSSSGRDDYAKSCALEAAVTLVAGSCASIPSAPLFA